jgi:hypothetical protein
VQAGCPGVTGPPVVVGTGLGAEVGTAVPLAVGGELVADPPPDRGVVTVPHPAASVAAATSGIAASSAARPARQAGPVRHRLVRSASSVRSVNGVNM